MTRDQIWYWTQLIHRTSCAYGVAPPVREAFTPQPVPPGGLLDLLLTVAVMDATSAEALYQTTLADMLAWKQRVKASRPTQIDLSTLEINI